MTAPAGSLEAKCAALEADLCAHRPLLVAYSGGVDSTFLLAFARRTLGREGALGVIADSPSLPRQGLADALALAKTLDVPVETLVTAEMENPQYASNPFNRCYFCKAELFGRMEALARARGFAAIAYGENAEDPAETRPGSRAAGEFSVLAPLRRAGLTKEEIRRLSRAMGLPTADAPSQPCLSSRIPFGTPVTREALAMVEAGEALLRGLGFHVIRVRHVVAGDGSPRARVQVGRDELDRIPPVRERLEAGLLALGYAAVEIDPEGYRITEMPT